MKTIKVIKVIDLLNMIANKKAPEKVIYNDKFWTFDEENQDYKNIDYLIYELNAKGEKWLYVKVQILEDINDEVEIIEDKKIERITNEAFLNSPFGELVGGKFNEIIDYINKEEK